MWVCPATYFPLSACAGMTSTLSAERQIRDWEVSSTVGVALKHVPALDSNPTLRRKTPQSRAQVLFFKDFSGMPSRLSGRTFGKGVGGLGGSSGWCPGRWHIHCPPRGPLAGAAVHYSELRWLPSLLLPTHLGGGLNGCPGMALGPTYIYTICVGRHGRVLH